MTDQQQTQEVPAPDPYEGVTLMLTKQHCPNCDQLKLMLEKPLKGEYPVQTVCYETDTQEFNKLASKHEVVSLPALIKNGKVLHDCTSLFNVKKFLK